MKYIVDIHGELEGDYEIIKKYDEPKTGKWIENDNGTWSCNRCHSWIPDEQHHYANFCLYCGADMRSEARKYLEYGKLIAKGIEQGMRGDSDE